MKSKNPFREIIRKRKNMSNRMVALVNELSKGNKNMDDFNSYNDIRTLNALLNRKLLNTLKWMEGIVELSDFDNEEVEKHAVSWENIHNKEIK